MALHLNLMHTGTSTDRHLVLKSIVIYGPTWSIALLATCLEVLCVFVSALSQYIVENNVPHQFDFKINLVAMSW